MGLSLTKYSMSLMISLMSWTNAWVACHEVCKVLCLVGSEPVDMQGLGLNAVGHGNRCM